MYPVSDLPIASIGRRNQIYMPLVITRGDAIILDDDVRIDAFTRIEGGIFTWIMQNTHIASFSSIMGGGECIIGRYCAIAQGVRIVTGVGHPEYLRFPRVPPDDDVMTTKRDKVVIGDYVFIGVNAVILPGVTIGAGAEIAAGTIVARDVPPWSIVAGSPARVIGQRRNWMEAATLEVEQTS